jgi:simple sugar transport system ATP-binding protein
MAILELENVSKHFGAIQAVDDVSLTLEAGEVVGLMGDNGAGKSTLVKIIAGDFRPSHGSMRMEGHELVLHRPIEAQLHGIEIVHQDLALCDNLTAAANVFLAREILKGAGPFRILDYASMYRRAGRYSPNWKSRRVRATLCKNVRRPAAGRGDRAHAAVQSQDRADGRADRRNFGATGRRGAESYSAPADSGIAIVLISHRMPDVFAVSDRIVVLRRGRKVADKAIAESSPEEVTGLITGAIETTI